MRAWLPKGSLKRSPVRKGSSRKPTNRSSSKKLKCKKKSLAKPGGGETSLGGDSSCRLTSGELAWKGVAKANLSGLKMMLQSKDPTVSKMAEEPLRLSPSEGFPKGPEGSLFQRSSQKVESEGENADRLDEEESYRATLLDDSEMEPEQAQHRELKLDNSVFFNEDSSQPLPMDRFFGSVAFMQDLPAAPLAPQSSSRREFRKLHFIAKEDEDEDEVP